MAAWLVAGCATVPPPQTPKPAVLADLAPYATPISGIAYLPLNTVCQQFQIQASWEPGTQVLQIVSGTAAVRLSPGFSTALVNGATVPLGAPVIVQGGQVWVPAAAAGRWISRAPVKVPAKPLGMHAIRTVVIDPGHGGHDAGASGPGGVREKDVVLDVARRLRDRLATEGIQVLMTRKDDRFIPLSQRAAFANQRKADLFLSVHANASRARGAAGYEAYYLSEATDDAARAFAAAENASLALEAGASNGPVPKNTEAIVWDLLNTENRTESRELASAVCRGMKWFLPAQNRGVKSARFYVLKWAQMPAVLIEVGFVTNRTEGQRLDTAAYRQRVCDGIAQGVLTYKSLYESTNGFSD